MIDDAGNLEELEERTYASDDYNKWRAGLEGCSVVSVPGKKAFDIYVRNHNF